MNKQKQLIKIEIPDETTKKMLKNKKTNYAVGAIADIVCCMQEDIDRGLTGKQPKK